MDKVKKTMRKIYDASAEIYGEEFYRLKAGHFFMQKKIETALTMGNFKKRDLLLEIGCANGSYTFEFAKLGFHITAIDLSPKCIAIAKERNRFKNVVFKVGDAGRLPFANASFDKVISFSILRYLPRPQKALAEMYRVLRPNGEIIVDFPNKLNPWFRFLKPLITGHTHPYDHHYNRKQVDLMLREAGFKDVKTRNILFTPKTVPDRWFSIFEFIEAIGKLPIISNFGAIIMTRGIK